jgi:hypothetical protein
MQSRALICMVGLISVGVAILQQQPRKGQPAAVMHSCRHPDNGIEATYTTQVFVACTTRASPCAQAAQSFKAPPNVHIIKGFVSFTLPWDSNGVFNRCDPKGNANVPCWAQSELYVYKKAPNPKCLCDSD